MLPQQVHLIFQMILLQQLVVLLQLQEILKFIHLQDLELLQFQVEVIQAGSNTVSYLVQVAGGGGGSQAGGGGGAGGFRESSKASSDCYSRSPLNAPVRFTSHQHSHIQ